MTELAMAGPDAQWGLGEQLLALAVDALHAGNWQRGGDKKVPRPKPIPRPGRGKRPQAQRLSIEEKAERLRSLRERDHRRREGAEDGS